MDLMSFTMAFIFIYGIVFINFSIAILALRKKQLTHWLTSIFLIDFGSMCLAGGICVQNNYQGILTNLAVFIPMALLSPSGLALALATLGVLKRRRKMAGLIAAGTLFMIILGAALSIFSVPWRFIFTPVYLWLCATFLILLIVERLELGPIKFLPKELTILLTLVLGVVLDTFGMTIFQIMDWYPGLYSLWIALILTILVILLLFFRFPKTFRLIEEQSAKIRYERSRLKKINRQKALDLLNDLIRNKKVYRDPELNLSSLAGLMDMSPPQLSEFLNNNLGTAFSDFINKVRIDEVKHRLKYDRDKSVIEIAFDCGFNSKSTFNLVFRKFTGYSPSQFRRIPMEELRIKPGANN